MSKLAEFRELERTLANQLATLEALKGDSGLQREIEFEQKLRELLAQYSYSLRNIISILDPQASVRRGQGNITPVEKGQRRARVLKQYSNPHTGEIIETKGGNHRQLKEWKNQYGAETVESWLKV